MDKTINVEKLIKEAIHHKFIFNEETQQVEDNLAELLDNTDEDTYYYVGINQFVLNYFEKNLQKNWKIKSIFQLGFPFIIFGKLITQKDESTGKILSLLENEYWSLFVFTKKDFQNVYIGFNDTQRYSFMDEIKSRYQSNFYFEHKNENEYFEKPIYNNSYSNNYYFEMINYVIEKDFAPEITDEDFQLHHISFSIIPRNNFYLKYINYLSRYKKSTIDDFGFPSRNEKIQNLNNLAQIIHSTQEKMVIKINDLLTDGIFLDKDSESVYSTINIATGSESEQYPFVIRSFCLSPYYIWALLNSEFTKDYVLSTFDYSELEGFKEPNILFDIPVPMEKIPLFYSDNINESFFKKKYELTKQSKLSVQEKVEPYFNTSFYDNTAKDIIFKDLKELKLCFASGAYKATIILAGSVLEAFLIDWLSEINKKNYFDEDYMVYDKYQEKKRRADLKDYINAIEELKKPTWYNASKKATEIRKKRNLIHAKLYINDKDISKETCTEVIDYLEYVINTRWSIRK